jgi:hypothetical protein
MSSIAPNRKSIQQEPAPEGSPQAGTPNEMTLEATHEDSIQTPISRFW